MSTMLKSVNVNDMIKDCRTNSKKRNFLQSFELYVILKDIDTKKQDTIINEFIVLPNEFSIKQKLCIFCCPILIFCPKIGPKLPKNGDFGQKWSKNGLKWP